MGFSVFFYSNVPKMDPLSLPRLRKILNFVEIQELFVIPIRNSQSFIPITYLVTRLSKKKTQRELRQPPSSLGLQGLTNLQISKYSCQTVIDLSTQSPIKNFGGGQRCWHTKTFSQPLQKSFRLPLPSIQVKFSASPIPYKLHNIAE